MISTYLGYMIASKNMTTTLSRVACQAVTRREADYYNTRIGSIKSVDEFMGDYRIYSYAMKAYGLEDMTYAKAFMKKVLTSDLSDSKSFANSLTDTRYKTFAAAFNFGTATNVAQSSNQEDDMLQLYTQSFANEEMSAKTESAYYAGAIEKVASVDDLLGNTRLKTYVLKAYGFDPNYTSNSYLKQILTSDISDPSSFVNTQGAAARALAAQFNFNADGTAAGRTAAQQAAKAVGQAETDYYTQTIGTIGSVDDLTADPRLFAYIKSAYGLDASLTEDDFNTAAKDAMLAASKGLRGVLAQFNFQPDGTVVSGDQAQTAAQIANATTAYMSQSNGTVQTANQKAAVMGEYSMTVPSFPTDAGFTAADAYFKSHIGSTTSIDQLVSDRHLFDYVKTAFGLEALDHGVDDKIVAYDLKQSARDPSYAALMGFSTAMAQFNFQTPTGTVSSGGTTQTAAQTAATSKAYLANAQSAQTALGKETTANYRTRIESVKNIKDFFKTNADADIDKTNDRLPELYQVALRSFGIGEGELTRGQLIKILESEPYDPKSYVSTLKDDRFINLSKAFNFGSDGNLKPTAQALSQTQVKSYISSYSKRTTAGQTGAALTKATDDVKDAGTYFATNIVRVKSLSQLLGDSKLTNFVLQANGIDPKSVTTATLKKAFQSDPSDPRSFINTSDGAKFKSVVSAFNFETRTASSSHPANLANNGNFALTDAKIGIAQNKGAIDTTNELYLRQTLEDREGETNDGVRLALYFQRKAEGIYSVYDIMGDTALYKVITTAYNLSSAISNMDVNHQASLLNKVLKVSDLQDPAKVKKLLQRFSAMYDLENSSTTSPALSILQGSSSVGISAETLMSIAQLRQG
jgi:hypothetical protein